jgi:hypothetical protein
LYTDKEVKTQPGKCKNRSNYVDKQTKNQEKVSIRGNKQQMTRNTTYLSLLTLNAIVLNSPNEKT